MLHDKANVVNDEVVQIFTTDESKVAHDEVVDGDGPENEVMGSAAGSDGLGVVRCADMVDFFLFLFSQAGKCPASINASLTKAS